MMAGPLALVGAGEFLDGMIEVDRHLLMHGVRGQPPRAVVLPTASAPEGAEVFWRWGRMGLEHFQRLGVQAEVLPVMDNADAQVPTHVERVAEADFIYFSGGSPRYLLEVLQGSPLWEAVRRAWADGSALAGCSAGAMVMGAATRSFRAPPGAPDDWKPALGLVPGAVVMPHFDRWPLERRQPMREQMPAHLVMVGVDEDTALVWCEGRWQVMGRGSVTLWKAEGLDRYPQGSMVPMTPPWSGS